MICEVCNENVATVHITEIANKQKVELHLCEDCASEREYSVKSHFSKQNLFGGMILHKSESLEATLEADSEEEAEPLPRLRCEVCGLTFAKFRKTGRFGCANDYTVFHELLTPLLERIHSTSQHTGKIPARYKGEMPELTKLMILRQQLARTIQREEYEKAAVLRDEIYQLEERLERSK